METGGSPASGSFFPVGETIVTATATDANGNTATCSFTVTVNDTEAPVITCPEAVSAITENPGDSSVVVNYTTPEATDNCPSVSVICTPESGTSFPTGTTNVNCTAIDLAGNTSNCAFDVTVFDVCVQDNSFTNRNLSFNSVTGEYLYCCEGTKLTGFGNVRVRGCRISLSVRTQSV